MVEPAAIRPEIDPLVVDVYSGDSVTQAQLTKLALAGRPWCGVIAKASQGRVWDRAFASTWRAIRAAGGPRYGTDWFRGAYHFLSFTDDAADQAHTYLDAIVLAGGWDVGDLWPIVDVERSPALAGTTRTVVEQAVRTWAITVTRATGRAPMLYGGSYLADLGITDNLGCQLLWTADYSGQLPPSHYTRIGWTRQRVWGWQYRGVPASASDKPPPGYPSTTPIGDLDITAIVVDDETGEQGAGIAFTRTHNGCNPL